MAFDLSNYVPVAERLDKFRADHPTWGLTSSLLFHDDKRVVVRASITDDDGREVAAGHAEEVRGQGNVNRTSALENAETSAWGRALAALGYDVKGGIASQEEMKRAQTHSSPQQSQRPKQSEPAGEATHNLTSKMTSKIAGPDRQAFITQLKDDYDVLITKVPESKREAVEKLIESWCAERPFSDDV
jgi:hypothetical protein